MGSKNNIRLKKIFEPEKIIFKYFEEMSTWQNSFKRRDTLSSA